MSRTIIKSKDSDVNIIIEPLKDGKLRLSLEDKWTFKERILTKNQQERLVHRIQEFWMYGK